MKRTPLKRKTPLRSTGAPRRRKVPLAKSKPAGGCMVRGCKTRSRATVILGDERWCAKHGTAEADKACGAFVRDRDPRCVACGRFAEGVQWAHVHSRGMRWIRWDADNSVGLCQRCHYSYTQHPSSWIKFIEARWPGRWSMLLRREMFAEHRGHQVDRAEVIASYRAGEPWRAADPPASWRPVRQRR